MGDRTTRALHVGIDAREIVGRPTGVGRFLANVLQTWAADPALAHRFTLFLPSAGPDWLERLGDRFAVARDPAATGGTWWEQIRLPRLAARAGVDVLLSPGYTAPLRLSCPSVVVIHDVSFFAHPEWFSWREGVRRRWLTRRAARRAAVVVTVSEFSAAEIERWIGVPRSAIRVVRHGAPAVSREIDSVRPPLVLFVGSLFNRRKLPETIGAFARVVARVPDARLVLVGDNRTAPRQDPAALAAEFGVSREVDWRDYVTDGELDCLYERARVFVFLSEYEGFAMTPLEAVAHGVPPILLDVPVAREVYGAAALYVPPDIDRIAAAMTELLTERDEPRSAARRRDAAARSVLVDARGGGVCSRRLSRLRRGPAGSQGLEARSQKPRARRGKAGARSPQPAAPSTSSS